MPEYLLDSDVIIWCLRGKAETVQFVRSISQDSLPASSALSLLEVELGMKKGEEEKTQQFLNSMKIVPVTSEIVRKAAEYIRYYHAKGREIDFVDAAIAASAFFEEKIIITYNLKHFPMTEVQALSPSGTR